MITNEIKLNFKRKFSTLAHGKHETGQSRTKKNQEEMIEMEKEIIFIYRYIDIEIYQKRPITAERSRAQVILVIWQKSIVFV